MEFNEKLVALRREKRITQSELAAALGVTRQTVYKWETGQSYPEAMTLFAMRNLFNVPTDILLDNTVTLSAYKESLTVSEAATVCNRRESTTENVSASTSETGAEAVAKAEPETEKKKKGLFSRWFNR